MRIQTEYTSCKNRSSISSSNDFLAHQQCSQRRCCVPRLLCCDSTCSQACGRRSKACGRRSKACGWRSKACGSRSQVLPGLLSAHPDMSPALLGAPRRSQVHLKATASVQATLGFNHPGILVSQLRDTPRDIITFRWCTELSIRSLIILWQCQCELYPKLSSMALGMRFISLISAGVQRLFSQCKIILTDWQETSAKSETGFQKWTPCTDPSPHSPQMIQATYLQSSTIHWSFRWRGCIIAIF